MTMNSKTNRLEEPLFLWFSYMCAENGIVISVAVDQDLDVFDYMSDESILHTVKKDTVSEQLEC